MVLSRYPRLKLWIVRKCTNYLQRAGHQLAERVGQLLVDLIEILRKPLHQPTDRRTLWSKTNILNLLYVLQNEKRRTFSDKISNFEFTEISERCCHYIRNHVPVNRLTCSHPEKHADVSSWPGEELNYQQIVRSNKVGLKSNWFLLPQQPQPWKPRPISI